MASSEIFSRLGTLVLDSARVIIIVCVIPGRVSCVPSAAADARNDVTPGTTIDSTSSFSNSSICSLIAPYTAGSPSCNLITVFPFFEFFKSKSKISSRTSFAASCFLPFLLYFKISGGIKEPE